MGRKPGPAYAWTPSRERKLIRLYTLTPLDLDHISTDIEDQEFHPKVTNIREQLQKLLGPNYHNYHSHEREDRTLLRLRLRCIKYDKAKLVAFLEAPDEFLNEFEVNELEGDNAITPEIISNIVASTEMDPSDLISVLSLPMALEKADREHRHAERAAKNIIRDPFKVGKAHKTNTFNFDIVRDRHRFCSAPQVFVPRIPRRLSLKVSSVHCAREPQSGSSLFRKRLIPLKRHTASSTPMRRRGAACGSRPQRPMHSSHEGGEQFILPKDMLTAMRERAEAESTGSSAIKSRRTLLSLSTGVRSLLRSMVRMSGNYSPFRTTQVFDLSDLCYGVPASKCKRTTELKSALAKLLPAPTSDGFPSASSQAFDDLVEEDMTASPTVSFVSDVLSLQRRCCSALGESWYHPQLEPVSGRIHNSELCKNCRISKVHYYAAFSPSIDDLKRFRSPDFVVRDKFANTLAHYIATRHDINLPWLEKLKSAGVCLTDENFAGATFLFALNPVIFGYPKDELRSIFKVAVLDLQKRDHYGQSFLHCILRNIRAWSYDCSAIAYTLRVSRIDIHALDNQGSSVVTLLERWLSASEISELAREYSQARDKPLLDWRNTIDEYRQGTVSLPARADEYDSRGETLLTSYIKYSKFGLEGREIACSIDKILARIQSVEMRNREGNTALLLAIAYRLPQVVRRLLLIGACLVSENYLGQSLIEIARDSVIASRWDTEQAVLKETDILCSLYTVLDYSVGRKALFGKHVYRGSEGISHFGGSFPVPEPIVSA